MQLHDLDLDDPTQTLGEETNSSDWSDAPEPPVNRIKDMIPPAPPPVADAPRTAIPRPNIPRRHSREFLIGVIEDELPRMRRRLRNGGLETRRHTAVGIAMIWVFMYQKRMADPDVSIEDSDEVFNRIGEQFKFLTLLKSPELLIALDSLLDGELPDWPDPPPRKKRFFTREPLPSPGARPARPPVSRKANAISDNPDVPDRDSQSVFPGRADVSSARLPHARADREYRELSDPGSKSGRDVRAPREEKSGRAPTKNSRQPGEFAIWNEDYGCPPAPHPSPPEEPGAIAPPWTSALVPLPEPRSAGAPLDTWPATAPGSSPVRNGDNPRARFPGGMGLAFAIGMVLVLGQMIARQMMAANTVEQPLKFLAMKWLPISDQPESSITNDGPRSLRDQMATLEASGLPPTDRGRDHERVIPPSWSRPLWSGAT